MAETKAMEAWHGSYLDEDEIVSDMLAKIEADPEAVKRWTDPASWRMPIGKDGKIEDDAPKHAGCLMFVGMQVRNYYGLWREDCPYTKADGPDLEITDGVITDARHPDNVSGRIIDRVRAALSKATEAANGK